MSEVPYDTNISPIRMIDVSAKGETVREAVAACKIFMNPVTLELIRTGKTIKGDVLAVAETAGILAAKETPRFIPMCHPLLLTNIAIDFYLPSNGNYMEVTAKVRGTGKTGFEMEAFMAASITAINIYDMCKAIDKGMYISELRLLRKTGGKSGTYVAEMKEKDVKKRQGKVLAVCIGEDFGSKKPVDKAVLEKDQGLVGDSHAGSIRQVSLLAQETIDKMMVALKSISPEKVISQDIHIEPGDSAENILTGGLDLTSLNVGDRIRIGKEIILEICQIGKMFHKPGFYLLPLEGIFANVVHGGTIYPGDTIHIE